MERMDKYRFFRGRAAWTVIGQSVCKAGIIKHNNLTCFDAAYTRYIYQGYSRVFGWKTGFISWL